MQHLVSSLSVSGRTVEGELLCRVNHVAIISNESLKTLFVAVKSNALICHFRLKLIS